jgi:hypothetical protein
MSSSWQARSGRVALRSSTPDTGCGSCSPPTPYPSASSPTATPTPQSCGRRRRQSAGRTDDPWLGPDILEVIDALAEDGSGVDAVLVCACGFVADHLEVRYDLDIEASQRAAARGLAFDRTASVEDDPAVMASLAGTIHQRVVAGSHR